VRFDFNFIIYDICSYTNKESIFYFCVLNNKTYKYKPLHIFIFFIMKTDFDKYIDKKLVVFSVDIKQKQHKNGNYKKEILYIKDWENLTLDNTKYNPKYNGLAMLTGKINNIIVIDIDNIEHWNEFLEENCKDEPDTVRAISGSGGIHLYFKYSDDLNEIKTSSKCFDSNYDIDIRTNGGNIIIPPTSYYNKNLDKQVEYKWEKSIFDFEPVKFPLWMKKILLKNSETKNDKKKKTLKKTEIKDNKEFKEETKEEIKEYINTEIDEEDKNLNIMISYIEYLIDLLSYKRCDNYTDWINVGNK
jgi:hypothetical protein